MVYKQFIANLTERDPGDKKIDLFLSDDETGSALREKIDEIITLRKQIALRIREIKALCKFRVEDWKSEIERIIENEVGNGAIGWQTRERMAEIEHAVKVALDEDMKPGDIMTIIEIMVIGMQPGEAKYLPDQGDHRKKRVRGKGENGGTETENNKFLKTKI